MHLRTIHVATLVVGLAVVAGAGIGLLQKNPSREITVTADAPIGTAKLSLLPATQTVKVGDETVVDIIIETDEPAAGVDLYISYNPTLIEVVDADAQTPGIQITPTGLLPVVAANETILASGKISFSAMIQPTESGITAANSKLASIRFKAKNPGSSPLKFDYAPGLLSDTNIIKANDGRDLLSKINEAAVTVSQ